MSRQSVRRRTAKGGSAKAGSPFCVVELSNASGCDDFNEDLLRHFLSSPHRVLPFDEADAGHVGVIKAQLEGAGTPIGSYDLLIAVQAPRHGATLVTANTREFARVPGLKVEDWGG